jgi:hypothetical protein
MVLGVQILGVIFGVFMAYFSFLHFKRNEYTVKEFMVWLALWILLIVISLFPGILDFFVVKLSLSRTMDFLIIAGFMILTAMFVYTYTLLRQNQRKIEEVVRNVALKRK